MTGIAVNRKRESRSQGARRKATEEQVIALNPVSPYNCCCDFG